MLCDSLFVEGWDEGLITPFTWLVAVPMVIGETPMLPATCMEGILCILDTVEELLLLLSEEEKAIRG